MEFSALGKNKPAKVAKKDVPLNIAIRLERIDVSQDAGTPSVFHGFDVTNNQPIRIRMMTVEEGVAVNQRKNETLEEVTQRLKDQYIGTGEKHRPRPSEINNADHKTHCQPGGLLMFNKALKNDDGSYRAHWVETLEPAPGAGCDQVDAHIRIEDIRDPKTKQVTGTQVVADVVDLANAEIVTKENAINVLSAIFANESADGKEKFKPFVFVRLASAETGKIVLPPARANAKYLVQEHKDADTGNVYETRVAAPAVESIMNLNSPENTSQDGLVIRAALFGLGDEPGYPAYAADTDPKVLEDLAMITDAVRGGQLKVELVGGQRIAAGPATRASIIKAAKGNAKNPLNTVYTVRNDKGFTTERRFAPTFLTTKIGQDGHRLFVKALPVDLYPNAFPIAKLVTKNDLAADASDAAKERVAEASASDLPESVGDADVGSLDEIPTADVDAQLARSTSALEVM